MDFDVYMSYKKSIIKYIMDFILVYRFYIGHIKGDFDEYLVYNVQYILFIGKIKVFLFDLYMPFWATLYSSNIGFHRL